MPNTQVKGLNGASVGSMVIIFPYLPRSNHYSRFCDIDFLAFNFLFYFVIIISKIDVFHVSHSSNRLDT